MAGSPSWTNQITSISTLDPCHPFLVCTGGSKMAVFEVKIRSQWQGHPGTLESKWKLFNASNHIYINRKTWFGATLTPAILLLCATGGSKMAGFEVKIRSQWQGYPFFLGTSGWVRIWLILGHNGRDTSLFWNHCGHSTHLKSNLLTGIHVQGLPLLCWYHWLIGNSSHPMKSFNF